jgi:hypothetical protein
MRHAAGSSRTPPPVRRTPYSRTVRRTPYAAAEGRSPPAAPSRVTTMRHVRWSLRPCGTYGGAPALPQRVGGAQQRWGLAACRCPCRSRSTSTSTGEQQPVDMSTVVAAAEGGLLMLRSPFTDFRPGAIVQVGGQEGGARTACVLFPQHGHYFATLLLDAAEAEAGAGAPPPRPHTTACGSRGTALTGGVGRRQVAVMTRRAWWARSARPRRRC